MENVKQRKESFNQLLSKYLWQAFFAEFSRKFLSERGFYLKRNVSTFQTCSLTRVALISNILITVINIHVRVVFFRFFHIVVLHSSRSIKSLGDCAFRINTARITCTRKTFIAITRISSVWISNVTLRNKNNDKVPSKAILPTWLNATVHNCNYIIIISKQRLHTGVSSNSIIYIDTLDVDTTTQRLRQLHHWNNKHNDTHTSIVN